MRLDNYAYWLDLIEYSTQGLLINHYILLYLKNNPARIPSVHFWAITLILVSVGVKINIQGHILTIKDCFEEMEDMLEEGKL